MDSGIARELLLIRSLWDGTKLIVVSESAKPGSYDFDGAASSDRRNDKREHFWNAAVQQ